MNAAQIEYRHRRFGTTLAATSEKFSDDSNSAEAEDEEDWESDVFEQRGGTFADALSSTGPLNVVTPDSPE